ncbi:MAG: ubiquinol-cytochrome c reductase iron-sulfur subunit [Kiloniellaceae bacterium]|nr:ubiquinol-cytochrome c reductase iron-sulfur subunit [Kiloniellaceae bacterium]
MAETATPAQAESGETRRDFLYLAAAGMGAIGTACVAWPLIDSMNPSAEVLALASTEVDLGPIAEGQRVTVTWRGNPVFIDHRTQAQIQQAEDVDIASLPDPQADADRVETPEWLIVIGVCTHLGCVPLGQRTGQSRGDFGGWFCPCHGSHYDTSGRIRKGPAPLNLPVPPYQFTGDNIIVIG